MDVPFGVSLPRAFSRIFHRKLPEPSVRPGRKIGSGKFLFAGMLWLGGASEAAVVVGFLRCRRWMFSKCLSGPDRRRADVVGGFRLCGTPRGTDRRRRKFRPAAGTSPARAAADEAVHGGRFSAVRPRAPELPRPRSRRHLELVQPRLPARETRPARRRHGRPAPGRRKRLLQPPANAPRPRPGLARRAGRFPKPPPTRPRTPAVAGPACRGRHPGKNRLRAIPRAAT